MGPCGLIPAAAATMLYGDNAVIWLDRIDPSRHLEYADVERLRLLGSTPSRQTLRSRLGRVWRGLWLGNLRK